MMHRTGIGRCISQSPREQAHLLTMKMWQIRELRVQRQGQSHKMISQRDTLLSSKKKLKVRKGRIVMGDLGLEVVVYGVPQTVQTMNNLTTRSPLDLVSEARPVTSADLPVMFGYSPVRLSALDKDN